MQPILPKKVHLVFRADASSRSGIGHLMRCFGLAQWSRSRGYQTTFLSNIQTDSFFFDLASRENINVRRIPTSHPHPDDIECAEEILSTNGESRLWFILDGYHFDETYQKRLRNSGARLAVIDDNAHLSEYPVDVLVNPNLYADSLHYKTLPHTLKLLGPNFLLLRNDLLLWKNMKRDIADVAGKVLVTMGGSDPVNFTAKVVEAFDRIKDYNGEIKIVLGPLNRYEEDIENCLVKTHLNAQLVKNPNNFAELIAWADMGITAAGTSTWEMSLLGLPIITVSVAENQNRVGDILKQNDAAFHLGWHEKITIEEMADAVNSLIYDYKKRFRLSSNQQQLVDGHGTRRVVSFFDILTTKKVPTSLCTIRSVIVSDCIPLWHMANDPRVRKNSFQNHFISFEEHRAWFLDKIRSDQTCFLILEIETVTAGQIRYALTADFAEVSFTIAAPFRGMGLAKVLVENTWAKACEALNVAAIKGRVKKHNMASIKTFQKAGFIQSRYDKINGEECLVFEKRCP